MRARGLRHGAGAHRDRLLRHAVSAWRGRSRLLPRNHPLSHFLVPGACAGAHRCPVHSGGAACNHAWGARPRGLALAVHHRRHPRDPPRRRRILRPHRQSRTCRLAYQGRRIRAQGRASRGRGSGEDRGLCRSLASADAATRARARAALFPDGDRALRHRLLDAASHPDLLARSGQRRLSHGDPLSLRGDRHGRMGTTLRPHGRAALAHRAAAVLAAAAFAWSGSWGPLLPP